MKTTTILTLCALTALVVLPAGADVLYSTYNTKNAGLVSGMYSADNGLSVSIQPFRLATAGTATTLTWEGVYEETPPGAAPTFTISFYSSMPSTGTQAQMPTNPMFTMTGVADTIVPTGEPYDDSHFVAANTYTMDLGAGVALPTSKVYLVIKAQYPWAWATTTQQFPHSRAVYRYATDGTFYSYPVGNMFVFELATASTAGGDPVPEPATLSLVGLGLAGLATRRLRRKA